MTPAQRLYSAARMNNLKPPDEPIDPSRLRRAESFASRIMGVIGPYCQRKNEAHDALVAAAYVADARIQTNDSDT